jgi:4-hydroxy-tetrahydrodipicolinate synthase
MNKQDWRGVFPALTTKFKEDFSLDFPAMAEHLEFQLAAGVHGVILLGSLGENPALSMDEKVEVVRFFAAEVAGRVPVVACVAESGLREALQFVTEAEKAGADGFMVLPPMRYASDRDETLAWFRSIAEQAQRPLMIYNNPIAYGTDLLPEDFADLAGIDTIQAIKESSADTRRIGDIRRLTGDRYALFCGVDDIALECFMLGAVGWVAGLVVAFPQETVRLYELCRAGRWDEAKALYEWFLPLLHLDIGSKFVQQIKLVEELHGVGSARVRAPRLALNEAETARVKAIYREAMASRPAL